jgi:hypothetical protein
LFVVDGDLGAVQIFDVAMDPTAVAAPIAKAGAPLVSLQLFCAVAGESIAELTGGSAVAALAATPLCDTRVFVSNGDTERIVEMTRDGVRVRAFSMCDIVGATVLGLGDGWLFAVEDFAGSIHAVALADRPDLSWKALQPLGLVCSRSRNEQIRAVVFGQMILISYAISNRIDIVPLTPPFV